MRPVGLCQLEIPVTSSAIEPATSWLVVRWIQRNVQIFIYFIARLSVKFKFNHEICEIFKNMIRLDNELRLERAARVLCVGLPIQLYQWAVDLVGSQLLHRIF